MIMHKFIIAALLASITVPAVPVAAQGRQHQGQSAVQHQQQQPRAQRNDNRRDNRNWQRQRQRQMQQMRRQQARQPVWQSYDRYDYNRVDPRYGGYQAERYYRDGRYYQQRRLSNNDRIYRGSNGRYYCRRSDGTTGLIIGAIGGTLLGRTIAPSGSKTLGSILGGASGAMIGRSIGRDGVRCR
jgi:hypothetical protein